MPLSVSVTAAQSLGVPSIIVLTDASTGSDGSITNRKVYLRTSTNQWLTETQQISSTIAYTDWPIADGATINLDVLTEATALEITVVWQTGAGATVYTFTDEFIFDNQNYIFQLGVLSNQTSSPGVLQDTNYYWNLVQFICNLDNAEVAITVGGDIYSSQQALNRNQIFIDNEAKFF